MNGTYGITKPAYITSEDIDIFYHYRPTRNSSSPDFPNFKQLERSLLASTKANVNNNEGSVMELPGLYDLRLPLDIFGEKGFYTIYIKPREIFGKITDVSTLAAHHDVRGVVIDITDLQNTNGTSFTNGSLVGYRIEYLNDNGVREDFYRIITSNNLCEPIAQNLDDSSHKGVRYGYNNSSTLMFCTVTPSTAESFNSTNMPYIGKPTQDIILINTKFNPVCIEIEMVDHDIETLSTMVEGSQIRDLNNGIITTFDDNGAIYHQASYGQISNPSVAINHDFKQKMESNIDFSQEAKHSQIIENI